MSVPVTDRLSELRAVVSICELSEEPKAELMARLTANHFGNIDVNEMFSRLLVYAAHGKTIPTLRLLRGDPTLSDEARAMLDGVDEQHVVSGAAEMEALIELLEQYRQLRVMRRGIEDAFKELDKKGIDVIGSMKDKVRMTLLDADQASEDTVLRLGVGNNTTALARRIITADRPTCLPTGFVGFDRPCIGLDRKEMLTIAANSGGGKSVMAAQMALNFTEFHKADTIVINYELPEEQYYERLWSNRSGIPYARIRDKSWNQEEKKIALLARRAHEGQLMRDGVRLDIRMVTKTLPIQKLKLLLKPMRYRVVIIDYLGLLTSDVKGRSQQEELSDLARECKWLATETDSTVVLVAQADKDERKIKYSQGIFQHSAAVWLWIVDDPERQTGRTEVKGLKMRSAEPSDWFIHTDLAHMRITDWDADAVAQQGRGGTKKPEIRRANVEGMLDDEMVE